MDKNYAFTGKTKIVDGVTVHQIISLKPMCKNFYPTGSLGGWIEKEENLAQTDDCWIDDTAVIYGNAQVKDNAFVSESIVHGNAILYGNVNIVDSHIYGNAEISGNAHICKSEIHDNATISDHVRVTDAKIYGDAWLRQNAVVEGDAGDKVCVYGRAILEGNARAHINAEICGKAHLNGTEALGKDGYTDGSCVPYRVISKLGRIEDKPVCCYLTKNGDKRAFVYGRDFGDWSYDQYEEYISNKYNHHNQRYEDGRKTQLTEWALCSDNFERMSQYLADVRWSDAYKNMIDMSKIMENPMPDKRASDGIILDSDPDRKPNRIHVEPDKEPIEMADIRKTPFESENRENLAADVMTDQESGTHPWEPAAGKHVWFPVDDPARESGAIPGCGVIKQTSYDNKTLHINVYKAVTADGDIPYKGRAIVHTEDVTQMKADMIKKIHQCEAAGQEIKTVPVDGYDIESKRAELYMAEFTNAVADISESNELSVNK